MTHRPFISVITVVRNGKKTLEQTIASVSSQQYDNLEHIIVDGASTDGTLDLLRKCDSKIRFISEPDRGVYDAMNKGVALAKGQWLYFLGADDRLAAPETLATVAPSLDKNLSLLFGSIHYQNGRIVKSRIGPRILLHNTVHHQSAFYNADLFKEWRYDCNFQIVADYELNLVIYLSGQTYGQIQESVAVCGEGGVSLRCWKQAAMETNAIRRKHLGPVANLVLSTLNGIEFALESLLMPWRRQIK